MDNQQIFDTVKAHLLAQGRRSVAFTGRCEYFAIDGTKCAVGCLLNEADFNMIYNQSGITSPEIVRALKNVGIKTRGKDRMALLKALQRVHDECEPVEWAYKLSLLAEQFGLTP